ncbi:PLP-dependent aminotransferase family protein, partial [Burkholderia cenocepacia]
GWRCWLGGGTACGANYRRLVKSIDGDSENVAVAAGAGLERQGDVAASLGVRGQTVTKAYKELERQGLIRCEVGRGSVVAARVTESMSHDILDTTERELGDFSIARIVHTPEHDGAWRGVCAALAGTDDQPGTDSGPHIAGLGGQSHAGAAGDGTR